MKNIDTQNMKNEENIIYIESVSDFLKQIESIDNEKDKLLFYRGHSNDTYELKPSIYRDDL